VVVITEPTNLYEQSDFPQVERALIFHLAWGRSYAPSGTYVGRRPTVRPCI
jgi:hypothetical protein